MYVLGARVDMTCPDEALVDSPEVNGGNYVAMVRTLWPTFLLMTSTQAGSLYISLKLLTP